MRPILIAVVFGSMIALLLTGPWSFDSPVEPPTAVPAWVFSPATVRQPTLQPRIQLAGFTYRCSDCHDLFRSPSETTRTLTQHVHIVLKHGINTRCFNCHHPTHRDFYVDDYGQEIPYDQPQLLCAKCHGPVYRDWLNRSHGRTNGYWNASMGPMPRRKCVECHDPHQPPFPPMTPAPPPHTLRMGDQIFPSEPAEVRDPLRVYQQDGPAEEPVEPPQGVPARSSPGAGASNSTEERG